MQCGDGLMHESVHVDNLTACTRKWFEVRALVESMTWTSLCKLVS